MRNIFTGSDVLNSILTNITRTIAVIVFGLLIAGDVTHSYGQDTETTSFKIVDTQNQNLDIPGMGQQEMSSTTNINVDVTSLGDRQYHVKINDFKVEGPQAAAADFSALIGFEVNITVAEDGTLEPVTGLEENETIMLIGGAAAFQDRLQGFFLQGPGGAISVGKSWSKTDTVPSNQGGLEMERVVETSYSTVGEESRDGRQLWVIDVETKMDISGSGSQGGQTMEMEMSGQGTGTIYVDKSSLMMIASEQEADLEGSIDMEMGTILMTVNAINSISIAD